MIYIDIYVLNALQGIYIKKNLGVKNMGLKFKNKRQGSALIFVLIAFLVISILGSSIIFIFNSNLKQAKLQQDNLEAYYLAYSGAEMAYASLMTISAGKYKYTEITDGRTLEENDIEYGNGKISIVAKKSDDEDFEGWIEIKSTAVLNRNNLSYTRTLCFNPEDPFDILWIN